MSRWVRAASIGLGLALSFASVAPSLAANNLSFIMNPPPGVTLTSGKPSNALQLRTGKVRLDPQFMRQVVGYAGKEKPGTVIVNTSRKFLYLVLGDGKAMRYGIGTARDGFEWSGTHKVTAKKEWPSWTPPAEMRKRQPGLPAFMEGGLHNPLGARALYIGSTLYRIHGTNEPWSIGTNVSSGCIRMVNDDVVDLYARVKIGAKVIVL